MKASIGSLIKQKKQIQNYTKCPYSDQIDQNIQFLLVLNTNLQNGKKQISKPSQQRANEELVSKMIYFMIYTQGQQWHNSFFPKFIQQCQQIDFQKKELSYLSIQRFRNYNQLYISNKKHFSMYYFYNYNMYENALPLLPLQNLPIINYQNDNAVIIETEVQNKRQEIKYDSHSVCIQKISATQCSGLRGKKKKENLTSKLKQQARQCQMDSFTAKRNIIPNNVNHILAFVQRKSKSSSIISRIIQSQNCKKFTSNNFYCYQGYLKAKLETHVNKNTLQTIINHLQMHSDIFSVEEQLFYNRVCRIAILYYLRNMSLLTTLNSKRLKQTNKRDHLQAQRSLIKFLQHHGSKIQDVEV